MESLAPIISRMEVIRKQKESGGSVAAVFPIHYPRALLRAFNYLPVEVWGPPGIDATQAAVHLQPYVCSIVHNSLAFLQTGGLEVADILVVPHTCDSLQGLGSILIDFVRPTQPVLPIYLPRATRESDIGFLVEELRSFYHRLQEITNLGPSDEELLQHILREEAADQLLAQLHRRRADLPFTDATFYEYVRSREYLPVETFIELAQQMLSHTGDTTRNGIPVLLSGIISEPGQLLELIAEIGGRVVADDLACTGRRLYPPGKSEDPFRRMAENILYAPPDPTRGNSIRDRLTHLRQLAGESGARGVVFYEVKFCEPELFDLPQLRRELQQVGIPSLVIEVDINDSLSHQVRTRLEAFLEMLQ